VPAILTPAKNSIFKDKRLWAAQLVRERNWHSSQQIQELADSNLELSLTLNSLEEIVPWILSWGKDCEVVSPTRLRKEVRSLSV
jgi:predicted DNA-binding transcriptional regulator YafY